MNVIKKGIMPDETHIQIEDWHNNYDFIPFGSTLASYPKSKVSRDGAFAPKGNEPYRFSFQFKSSVEADAVFQSLLSGESTLADYKSNMIEEKYADCI